MKKRCHTCGYNDWFLVTRLAKQNYFSSRYIYCSFFLEFSFNFFTWYNVTACGSTHQIFARL